MTILLSQEEQSRTKYGNPQITMRYWFISGSSFITTFRFLAVISDRMALTNVFSLHWSIILSIAGKGIYCEPLFKLKNLSRNPAGTGYCPMFFNTTHWGTGRLSPISCFCIKIWSAPQNIILLQVYLKTRVNTELSRGRKAHRDWGSAKPVHRDWHWLNSLSP